MVVVSNLQNFISLGTPYFFYYGRYRIILFNMEKS